MDGAGAGDGGAIAECEERGDDDVTDARWALLASLGSRAGAAAGAGDRLALQLRFATTLIEAHGGRVGFGREADGGLATWFTLPAAGGGGNRMKVPCPPPPALPAAGSKKPPRGDRERLTLGTTCRRDEGL